MNGSWCNTIYWKGNHEFRHLINLKLNLPFTEKALLPTYGVIFKTYITGRLSYNADRRDNDTHVTRQLNAIFYEYLIKTCCENRRIKSILWIKWTCLMFPSWMKCGLYYSPKSRMVSISLRYKLKVALVVEKIRHNPNTIIWR